VTPLAFAVLLAAGLVAMPTGAAAQEAGEIGGENPPNFSVSVGVKAGGLGQGASEVPEDVTYETEEGRGRIDPQIFGVFGGGGGGGPVLEVRGWRTVGLETGLYFTRDSAEGVNDIRNSRGEVFATVEQRQKTSALHVPLLLKVTPPFKKIRPILGIGTEFVLQQSSQMTYGSDEKIPTGESDHPFYEKCFDSDKGYTECLETHNQITPTSYTVLQVTAGVEFDAGPVRIPFELRAGYNLNWDENFDERVEVENAGQEDERFVYDGQYMGHFGVFVGVMYRWDTKL